MCASIKFGLSLDMIEMDFQEPNRNRRESKYFWDELFTLIPAAGFHGIEIPYEPKWDFGGRSGVPLSRYAVETKYGSVAAFRQSLRNQGIEQVASIYFNPSLFISSDLNSYFGAFGHFAPQALSFAAEIGSGVLTLTPTPAYGMLLHHLGNSGDWEQTKSSFLARTADLINNLARDAKQAGVLIAVKGEYWSLLRETGFKSFLDQLDNSVQLNLDTAHVQICGGHVETWVKEHSARIGSVHFTDTAFIDKAQVWRSASPEHPAGQATQIFRDLGQGTVDLKSACQSLAAAGYDGWIICSCRQTRDAMRAMLRTRHQIDQVIARD